MQLNSISEDRYKIKLIIQMAFSQRVKMKVVLGMQSNFITNS